MTIATRDKESVGSSGGRAALQETDLPRPTPRRVDKLGVAAVGLAAAGLVGTLVFLRPAPASAPQSISEPPVPDDWYLATPTVSAQQPVVGQPSVVGDRWWEDLPAAVPTTPSAGGPPARDQWYLEQP